MSIYMAILVLSLNTGNVEEDVQAFQTKQECEVYVANKIIALPSKLANQKNICAYFKSEWFPSADRLKWCAEKVDNVIKATYKCKEIPNGY